MSFQEVRHDKPEGEDEFTSEPNVDPMVGQVDFWGLESSSKRPLPIDYYGVGHTQHTQKHDVARKCTRVLTRGSRK